MKLKIFILFILLLSIGILNAQTDFRPGYIINMAGDTLFGDIDYRGDLLMGRLCKFRSENNAIKDYTPNDIAAFRFIDSKYYVSREINDKTVFLEILIKGKVNIYYIRDKNGEHYYLDKENVRLSEIPYEEEIKFVDDEQVFYESKIHIGLLKYFMQDAPELQSRIQSLKKPEHQNLIKLAEDYHNIVCDEEQCIIYEKKLPLLKISIEPFLGLTNYGYDKFIREYGGYLYFWTPRANEKLFFKTGLAQNKLTEEGVELNIYKIPIQFQYMYKAYRLKPHASSGINLFSLKYENYWGHIYTFSLNAGLNYQLTEKISMGAVVNSDYTPIFITLFNNNLAFDIISYSIIVGLRINL